MLAQPANGGEKLKVDNEAKNEGLLGTLSARSCKQIT
jgi:hypothetical protein